MNQRVFLFLKGLAMGLAEVVPGVSGGTIAFITGIYDRLLASIKRILGPEAWQTWRQAGFSAAWEHINGPFLLTLFAGMGSGLVIGILAISRLLESHPPVVWGFFFGLILASILYIGRQIKRWNGGAIGMLLLGTALAYWLTVVAPLQGSESLGAVFLAGTIAICALILPGISGSFILLLLGMYTYILGSVRDLLSEPSLTGVLVVVVFALGCLTGLAGFSRLLSWTLDRFRDPTLAILTGFMIGSLNKLWPWRNVVSTRLNSRGELVPLLETNVLPAQYESPPFVVAVIGAVIVGFLLVFLLERLGNQQAAPQN